MKEMTGVHGFICIFSKTMKETHGLSKFASNHERWWISWLQPPFQAFFSLCSLPALHLLYKIEDDNQKKRSAAVWS